MVVRHHRECGAIWCSFHQCLRADNAARTWLIVNHYGACERRGKAELARMMVSTPEPAANGGMKQVSLSPCAWALPLAKQHSTGCGRHRPQPHTPRAEIGCMVSLPVLLAIVCDTHELPCIALLPVVARGGTG